MIASIGIYKNLKSAKKGRMSLILLFFCRITIPTIPTEGTSIKIQIAKPYRNLMMKALP
jgi:hypothetical protein